MSYFFHIGHKTHIKSVLEDQPDSQQMVLFLHTNQCNFPNCTCLACNRKQSVERIKYSFVKPYLLNLYLFCCFFKRKSVGKSSMITSYNISLVTTCCNSTSSESKVLCTIFFQQFSDAGKSYCPHFRYGKPGPRKGRLDIS